MARNGKQNLLHPPTLKRHAAASILNSTNLPSTGTQQQALLDSPTYLQTARRGKHKNTLHQTPTFSGKKTNQVETR